METQMTLQPSSYEQTFISILRTLPAERVAQILDYARYIQSQTHADFEFLDEEETEEEILVDEERWEARFAASQSGLAKMAEKVRADIRSGRTLPLTFTKDGGIAPG
ncbi:MAG: hypothetical protein K1X65_01400 [Caldilineales bacterium]|nr:hypothetical protein [Caldilineales bacterium]MCW5859239.1 hypothetical protein [Caldilineales bacterium]